MNYFLDLKSATAGNTANTPAAINKIPEITQPAPIEYDALARLAIEPDASPFAALNAATMQNAKIPATIKLTTATRFNTPANLSNALTFNSGKIIPAHKITKATITRMNANKPAHVEAYLASVPPKIHAVPVTSAVPEPNNATDAVYLTPGVANNRIKATIAKTAEIIPENFNTTFILYFSPFLKYILIIIKIKLKNKKKALKHYILGHFNNINLVF